METYYMNSKNGAHETKKLVESNSFWTAYAKYLLHNTPSKTKASAFNESKSFLT